MERQIPDRVLSILELWFSVSVSCVKWDGQLSRFFHLAAGVRQGGFLFPTLFSVYIDGIIDKVKSTNVGCYVSLLCCCIYLYADLVLLANSITVFSYYSMLVNKNSPTLAS